jgi:DegV family protein with EDD domain
VARVYVVTDGDAHLNPEIVDNLNITVVPLTVEVGGEVYRDDRGDRNEELLLRMESDRVRPRVIGPTVAEFQSVFGRLSRVTDQIISIHSSAALSDIVRNARAAAAEFLGRCDIVVVDSQTTSLGLGILAQDAAGMAAQGYGREDILRRVRGMISRIYVVMFTDSLDYLERSGLVSPAQFILGSMLGIKPYLDIEEGQIIPMEKARNRDKGIDKLVEFVGEFSSMRETAILQSTSFPTDETLALRERLQSFFPDQEFPILIYGALLASHVGPDGLGLVAYEGLGRRDFY